MFGQKKAYKKGFKDGYRSVRVSIEGPGCDPPVWFSGPGATGKIAQPVEFLHECNDGKCRIEEHYLLEWTMTISKDEWA